MSDLLNTGLSGLRAYSRSLATIGDNIANAQTPGYARRTLALREVPGGGPTVLLRAQTPASGVESAGITRATDIWLQTEARLSSGDSERTRLRLAAADDVGTMLADSQNGIASGLTAIFTTADALTADPGSQTLRARFIDAADGVGRGFRQLADRLTGLAAATSTAASDTATGTNEALAALDSINASLLRAREGSAHEAGLLDERDRLVDQMASRLDVTASFGNRGTVTLRAAASGDVLVGTGAVRPIAAQTAADGRVSFSLAGQPLAVGSGAMAGLVDAGQHIADERARIDALADGIAAQLNAAHQSGIDGNGQPGRPLFVAGGGAAVFAATSLMPSEVAAADSQSVNGNILALGNLRGPAGAEALWAGAVSRQSQAGASARAQHDAASFRLSSATEARDNIAAVDLDREAADLIRFQQAYSAAAQTIQVARDTMQALFNAI